MATDYQRELSDGRLTFICHPAHAETYYHDEAQYLIPGGGTASRAHLMDTFPGLRDTKRRIEVKSHPNRAPGPRTDLESRARAIELRESGMAPGRIAAQLHRSPRTIRRWVNGTSQAGET